MIVIKKKRLKKLFLEIGEIKELVMGIKEDVAAFTAVFNDAMDEITADINALVSAQASDNPPTPAEVTAQLQAMSDKLETIRNIWNPPATDPEPPSPSEPL